MVNPKPVLRIRNVPVFLPPSAAIGMALISYFAFPTALEIAGSQANLFIVSTIAIGHALALYLVILVHELGHVLAAQHYQYPVKGITLHLIGGHTAFTNRFEQSRHQLVVAVSGPAITILLGLVAFGVWSLSTSSLISSIAFWLMWGSLIGGVMNLLPGYPLDGGAALSALVWYFTRDPLKGQKVSALGGLVISALWVSFPMVLGSLFDFQPSPTDFIVPWLLGLWTAFGAWSQLQLLKQIEPTEAINPKPWQLRVRRAIATAPETKVSEAIELLQSAAADALLIEADGVIKGIVNRGLLHDVTSIDKPVIEIARQAFDADYISRFITESEFKQLLTPGVGNEWIVRDAINRIYGVAYRDEQELND